MMILPSRDLHSSARAKYPPDRSAAVEARGRRNSAAQSVAVEEGLHEDQKRDGGKLTPQRRTDLQARLNRITRLDHENLCIDR
jgi:hypothetical protein